MKQAIGLHSVAVNGGDELLYVVLKKGLTELSNTKIIAKTTNSSHSFTYLRKNVFWNEELIGENFIKSGKLKIIFRRWQIHKLGLFRNTLEFFSPNVEELSRLINQSDYIAFMPGGYLHEYYGVQDKAMMAEVIKRMGKPIYIFGPSFGPFKSDRERKFAQRLLNCADKIILRENISAEYVRDIDPEAISKTEVTTDVAFAYNYLFDRNVNIESIDENRVLLNFRNWTHGINPNKVIELGVMVSTYLYEQGFDIEYISTCQGVEGYADDSTVAKEIVEAVRREEPEYQPKIHTRKYKPGELLECMEGAAFYVGMRLHGAISSMLSYVPAFNIGYEHKSEGVYKTIGLQDYTVGIKSPISEIMDHIKVFVKEPSYDRREKFREAVKVGEKKAIESFKKL